jgi:hypothetical protein
MFGTEITITRRFLRDSAGTALKHDTLKSVIVFQFLCVQLRDWDEYADDQPVGPQGASEAGQP